MRFEQLSKASGKNDFPTLIRTIQKNPSLYDKQSQFLYYTDIGMLFHYNQQFDSSTAYLERASQIYSDLFTKSITNEAASFMINDNVRPYRSKPYEVLLLHQTMMINYMAMGKFDEALVETRRGDLLGQQWEAQEKSITAFTTDGLFQYLSAAAYDKEGQRDDAAISLFKSVQAYQKGIVSMPDLVRNSAYYALQAEDRLDDIKLLNLQPTAAKDTVPGFNREESEIILIGYAGKGPTLTETEWWGTWIKDGLLVVHTKNAQGVEETITMPAPGLPAQEYEKAAKGKKTESGTTLHVKFAMPQLKTFASQSDYFIVESPSLPKPVTSVEMNDFDKQGGKYLADNKTSILVRTVIRVILRTISTVKTKEQLKTGSDVANLLINLGTDLLTDQLEKADTRSAFLIPKKIHIARFPIKVGTHTLHVSVRSRSGTVVDTREFANIRILPGSRKILLYPCLF